MIICSRATNACLVQPIRSINEIKLHTFKIRTLRLSCQFELILLKKLFLILYSLCYFVVTKMSIMFHFNYFYTPRMTNLRDVQLYHVLLIYRPTLRTLRKFDDSSF